MRDVILQMLQAEEIAGIRAILLHAISAEATQVDEQLDVKTACIDDPMTLILTVQDTRAAPDLSAEDAAEDSI
jgi:hypothetical protein